MRDPNVGISGISSTTEDLDAVGHSNSGFKDPRLSVMQQCVDDGFFPLNAEKRTQYKHITLLGTGSSGYIEEVEYEMVGGPHTYVRKQIRVLPRGQREDIQKMFAHEIKNILRLRGHPHFVRVIDAYATERDFNLILLPKAYEGDLAQILDDYVHTEGETPNALERGRMAAILERAPGCLASVLAYMHQQRIRHKDINPRHILIHEGKVLWTGFDRLEYSSTSGATSVHTRRYAAPEVISGAPRDSKADIFSLGCVFLEIFYASAYKKTVLEREGLFSSSTKALNKDIASPENAFPKPGTNVDHLRFRPLTELIRAMTTQDSRKRPSANDICCEILSVEAFACSACRGQLAMHQNTPSKKPESQYATEEARIDRRSDMQTISDEGKPTTASVTPLDDSNRMILPRTHDVGSAIHGTETSAAPTAATDVAISSQTS
jgi:serine/threonine protein kinase